MRKNQLSDTENVALNGKRFASACGCWVSLACIIGCVSGYGPGTPLEPSPAETVPEALKHEYAVGVCAANAQGQCNLETGQCTGSLIAPNLVLTARHCVNRGRKITKDFCTSEFLGMVDKQTLKVTVNADPYAPGATPEWLGVEKVLLPPNAQSCDNDIALLILESSIPAMQARPIGVEVNADLVNNLPEKITIVGRGWVSTNLAQNPDSSYHPEKLDDGRHRRRVFSNQPMICASEIRGKCKVDDITEASGTFSPTSGMALSAAPTQVGDSGSGWIEQAGFDALRLKVFAVTSLGGFNAQKQPSYSGGVLLNRHKSFLVDGAKQAAKLSGTSLPAWAAGN